MTNKMTNEGLASPPMRPVLARQLPETVAVSTVRAIRCTTENWGCGPSRSSKPIGGSPSASSSFETAVGINGGIAAGTNVSADFSSGAGIGAIAGLSANAPADVENAVGNARPPPAKFRDGRMNQPDRAQRIVAPLLLAWFASLALLAVGSFAVPTLAHALTFNCPETTGTQVSVCNLGEDVDLDRNAIVGYDGTPAILSVYGNGFTTGSNAAGYTLNSVSLAFTNLDDGSNPGDIVVAVHEEESDGVPKTTAHATLTGNNPTDADNGMPVAFTAASGVTLAKGTPYYVVVSAPDAQTSGDHRYFFARTSALAETTNDGWTIDLPTNSVGGGAFMAISDNPMMFAVVATPIDGTTPPAPMAPFEPNDDNTDSRMYSLAVYEGASTSGAELALTPAFDSSVSSYSIPRPAAGGTQVTIAFQTHSRRTRNFSAHINVGGTGSLPSDISGVSTGAGSYTYTLPLSAVQLILTWESGDGTSDGISIDVPSCPTALASQETVCNLDETRASTSTRVGNDSGEIGVASAFVTGPGQYTLDSVHIAIAGVTGTGDDLGNLSVAIHSEMDAGSGLTDISDEPIGTLSGDNPRAAGVHEFTASGISLDPATRYWVVLRAPDAADGNYYRVAITRLPDQDASAGWSIGDDAREYDEASDSYTAVGAEKYRAISFAVIADVADVADDALRLRLRVFLESALP